jgi:predicted DNA-binding transcriptional regulator AlpA
MNTLTKRVTDVANPSEFAARLTLYRLPQVLEIVPVSKSHWWAGVASGRYPAGIKLSKRVTVWKSSDIQALIVSLKTSKVRSCEATI